MRDQAQALRDRAPLAARSDEDGRTGPETVVIGSGKGGVGKSVAAVLLASALARQGRRTLLVDGSLELGHLHILLGVYPSVRLESVVAGEARPADLLTPVTDSLWLLPADPGTGRVHALTSLDRARLHHRLCGLYDGFEAVIVDAGPGIEGVVRATTLRATRMIVVAVPEPASLSDAYALIKLVHLQVPTLPVGVLVNRVLEPDEARWAHERLDQATRRFLQRTVEDVGSMAEDVALRRAVTRPGGLLSERHPAIEVLAQGMGVRV